MKSYFYVVSMEAGYGHYRVIALSTCAQRDNATTRQRDKTQVDNATTR